MSMDRSNRSVESLRLFLLKHPRLHASLRPAARLARTLFLSRTQKLWTAQEHLFKSVVGGSLRVAVPNLGVFEVDGRSHILARLLVQREYEPRLLELLRTYVDPGKDAIDIGANVGLVTTAIARLLPEGKRVLAVEPTPGAMEHLKKNIEANGVAERVIPFQGVASETAGDFLLKVFPGMEEYSTLLAAAHFAVKNEEYKELPVPGETVDRLVEQHALHPGLIKIDTEGAEEQVLRGACETILKYRPVILCEFFPDQMLSEAGGTPGSVPALLRDYGYQVTVCDESELLALPQEFADQAAHRGASS
jgi:FkbM family methyltransferase